MLTDFLRGSEGRRNSLRAGIMILVSVLSIFWISSCSSYKNEILSRTDEVMVALINEDYSKVPGLSETLQDMGGDASEFRKVMERVEGWDIVVGRRVDDVVSVSVYITMENEDLKKINFRYRKKDHGWVMEDNIIFEKNIDFIPLEKDQLMNSASK